MVYKTIIFDFDGVLVDSYTCLPKVYTVLANKLGVQDHDKHSFVNAMLLFEDIADYFNLWDRRKWWSFLFGKDVDPEELSRIYWSYRTRYSRVIDGVEEAIKLLRQKGFKLHMVTGCDDSIDVKLMRIRASGLDKYFDEIIVYGCSDSLQKNLVDAIKSIVDRTSSKACYVDDKPRNLVTVRNSGIDVCLVNMFFRPTSYPYALAWQGSVPENTIVVDNMKSLVNMLVK